MTATTPSVALIHGGFVDGSGWRAVYDLLREKGHRVAIVQNPTRTLTEDVAFTKRAIDAESGPVVLVGHSYGGVVITETGGRDDRVAGLVYIAAFAPDKGESVVHPTGWRLEAVDSDPRRIKKVRIHRSKDRPIERDREGRRRYSAPEATASPAIAPLPAAEDTTKTPTDSGAAQKS